MKRITITPSETIRAGALLTQHCLKMGDDVEPGGYRYASGWNDDRVAREVGRITGDHVHRLRLSLDMKLDTATTGGTRTYRDPRVSLLIERHNDLVELIRSWFSGDMNTHADGAMVDRFAALKITADDLKATS